MNTAKSTMVIIGSRRGPLPVKAIGKIMLFLLRDAACTSVGNPLLSHPCVPRRANAQMTGAHYACLPRP